LPPGLKADLLFCPFTAPYYFDPRVPTICTVYDFQHREHPEFFTLGEWLERERNMATALERADALVAISDFTRSAAISTARVDPVKIVTIHPRVPLKDNKTPCITSVLTRLGLRKSHYLVYPANFWIHKNHDVLPGALAIARFRNLLPEGVRLVCTGVHSDRQRSFEGRTTAMGMQNSFVFPGYLPSSELFELLTNSAGLIFPSCYEGFGLPVVEAMAAGVPVACSNATSLPEVAGNAAVMFDPLDPEQVASAMIELLSNTEQKAKLVKAGRKQAERFLDTTTMAKQYWQLFAQVASARAKAAGASGQKTIINAGSRRILSLRRLSTWADQATRPTPHSR
jgi:glycosyltransferase involved in cell wall biosynthesis